MTTPGTGRQPDVESLNDHRCYVCGGPGVVLYQGLKDRLFGLPGEWSYRRCGWPVCGTLWLDPMPPGEEIQDAYKDYTTHQEWQDAGSSRGLRKVLVRYAGWGYLAAAYGGDLHSAGKLQQIIGTAAAKVKPVRRSTADHDAMYLRVRPGGSLLDVGCGGGDIMMILRRLGWNVVGVDFDSAAVRNARRKGLDVRPGALAEQAFPPSSFDAVTMSHVIEHLYDPIATLSEIRRVMKPGGRLVVVTPNAASRLHRKFGPDWLMLHPPHHLRIFSPHALAVLMGRAGLRTARLFTSIRAAHEELLAARAFRRLGRYKQGSIAECSLAEQLRVLFLQFLEYQRLKFTPLGGGETVAIAQRDA